MYIRDLKQYVEALCGDSQLELLGSNKEPLLQKIYGESPSSEQVKSVIAEAASFASNAEEQLFYEFVQNAYDADADSLFFYSNDKYLIVLNNGKPFYTDFDIFSSDSVREGQLYSFLAKGKSQKREDPDKMGKYGQGSKLLYTLIADVDDEIESEELLINALFENKKGPYVISWENTAQLANILMKQPKWILSKGDAYKENILFAKILMTYYPLTPGVDKNFFSDSEALAAIEAFDKLVNPRRNIQFLHQGTALIIPLGKGKYERICSNSNLRNVRSRLAGFAALTKGQERNKGKKVEHIYVMGEEVVQYEARSILIRQELKGRKTYYNFAFNSDFAKENEFVNFFKGLPIVETKLHLGFILDSQSFELDSSRQRINEKNKTKAQLQNVFESLASRLDEIYTSDRCLFDYVYDAVVASKVPEGEDFEYVRIPFEETFTPFIEKYIRCSDGTYKNIKDVRSYDEQELFPLDKLGIEKYKWIDASIKKRLARHNISVPTVFFKTILNDANKLKLQEWLVSLDRESYARLYHFFDVKVKEENLSGEKLYRSTKGNLFSRNELTESGINVYFLGEEKMAFGACEYVPYMLDGVTGKQYNEITYRKLKHNIAYFRKNDIVKEDAANILKWIIDKDKTYLNKVRSEVALLQNWHGEYVPFGCLFGERPQHTILFDKYLPKGYVPKAIIDCGLLLSPLKEKDECWSWIKRNWENLKKKEDWGVNTHNYISDIRFVYNESSASRKTSYSSSDYLTLYVDEKGRPTEACCKGIDYFNRLTKDEYIYLGEKINGLNLLPYDYYEELNSRPFVVNKESVSNIIGGGLSVCADMLKIIVKIAPLYLRYYCTKEDGNDYYVTKLRDGQKNYIDEVSKDLQEELSTAGFYKIPSLVQNLLNADLSEYRFTSNSIMLMSAIGKIKSPIDIFPLVKNANSETVEYFFNSLKTISIDGKLSKEDLRWQVIEFAGLRGDYNYAKIVFGLIQFEGYKLPESITKRYLKLNGQSYDTYKLDDGYRKDNERVEAFFSCLPDARFFKSKYYEGREENVSVETLYETLKGCYLTVYQLLFCIDYAIKIDDGCADLELDDSENLEQAMDAILKRNFVGFDKYFKIKDVDYDLQFYADKSLLLAEECLPQDLVEWLGINSSGLALFTRLKTDTNVFIKARDALLKNNSFENINCFSDRSNKAHINNTLRWLDSKQFTYVYDSDRYNLMQSIIDSLYDGYENMHLLRYTDEIEISKGNQKPKPVFNLEVYQDEAPFMPDIVCEDGTFCERLSSSAELQKFMRGNNIYAYNSTDMLYGQGFNSATRLDIQSLADSSDYLEYNDSVYNRWKEMDESKGITIYTSRTPIVMYFNIVDQNNGVPVYSERLDCSDFGPGLNKRVIVQYPNENNLSVLKMIAKRISSMPFFKEPFIALQALYVEEWEQSQHGIVGTTDKNGVAIDLSRSQLSADVAQCTIDKISCNTANNIEKVNTITDCFSGDELDLLNDASDCIRLLLETLSLERIQSLFKSKDSILNLVCIEGENKSGSKIRQIIGYIGELIYERYLKKVSKEYDFVADKGVGEYDFKILNEDKYVDVKTSLYTLKDGTAPLYIHRSQNEFMKSHPTSKYRIVRISLDDINLRAEYQYLREKYGVSVNPRENDSLKQECKRIADQYWQNAKIDDFESVSPEYAIRIVEDRM